MSLNGPKSQFASQFNASLHKGQVIQAVIIKIKKTIVNLIFIGRWKKV